MARRVTGMLRRHGGALLAVCLCPGIAAAQTSPPARVIVTVVDPLGGAVPGATVTLIGLEPATAQNAHPPAKTANTGVATIAQVTPGRYTIHAAFDGFDPGVVRDIRISPGDNRREIVLPLKGLAETVTVGGGQQDAALRSASSFGVGLSADEIGGLSDDPSELQRQISELGGPDAVIRIDSFEGQQLPPKSQIKSIHVTRDQFAAETEQPGATFVDVVTQPGIGPLRGSVTLSYRDGAMNGRNPFLTSGTKTPELQRGYAVNIGGTVVKERLDFSLAVNDQDQFANPILNANTITGASARVLPLRQGNRARTLNGIVNHALTRDQSLQFGYSQASTTTTAGVGGYSNVERAYTTTNTSRGFRVVLAGPMGRRTFINTRLNMAWTASAFESAVEAPTIVVLDHATMGGAQARGGTRARNYTLESDVDYVRGIHSWRAGIKIVGGTFQSDQQSNYLGTYTFSSVDDYDAGRPSLYTIETGHPSFSYTNLQGAVYFQDDIRLGKALTISPGVRYSAQQRIHDPGAIEPRLGLTWAPFTSGRTTIRASGGAFHGWLNTPVLAQAIRLDGTHQRQLVVRNPAFPDPGTDGTVTPPNRYLIGAFQLQQNVRYSAGIDQALTPRVRVSLIYSYWHMRQLPRGTNLNPLIDGVRPDPNFANVIATVTDAEIRRHDLNATFNINLAAGVPNAAASRVNWRRLTINGGYSALLPKRSGVGPFDVPPSGSLDTEWGRGPAHQRYLVNAAITSTQVRNLSVAVTLQFADGFVYHETTGTDDNGDGLLNDRPAGVGLWSLRSEGRETVSLRLSYALAFGNGAAPAQARYRLTPFVAINNLTNHANYGGYSGVRTSPNYAKPTLTANPRRVDVGLTMTF